MNYVGFDVGNFLSKEDGVKQFSFQSLAIFWNKQLTKWTGFIR